MAALDRAEFDAIEFDAAYTGDHETAAVRMSEMATTADQSDSMPRAEAFVRAGEQWLLADNPEAAANGFRMAIADGGAVATDPRVPLARALYQLGDAPQAQALIDSVKSDGRAGPRVCEHVAELLIEQSDLGAALEWATRGVDLIVSGGGPVVPEPRPAEPENGAAALSALLRLRFRIRNDLRLPEDDYDRMLDA